MNSVLVASDNERGCRGQRDSATTHAWSPGDCTTANIKSSRLFDERIPRG